MNTEKAQAIHAEGHDGCSCNHGQYAAAPKSERYLLARIGAALVMLAAALIIDMPVWAANTLFIAGWIVSGYDILWRMIKNIAAGKIFDENFLMGIATVGAICIGEMPEAAGVMIFYQLGEWLADKAAENARESISRLVDISPDKAELLGPNGERTTVKAADVVQGSLIYVPPGEKIPLDGVVTEGASDVVTAALTGESIPEPVGPESAVLAGCLNQNGALVIRTTAAADETVAAKIVEMVEQASRMKSKTVSFITRFAKVYTPIVVFSALAVALVTPLFTGMDFAKWTYRALILLVASCPCALVISVPISLFAGMGAASRQGILIKGADYIEELAKIRVVAFDKTGTLTKGEFHVSATAPAEGFSERELLEIAASVESSSSHPIARSITRAAGSVPETAGEIREMPGLGIVGVSSRGQVAAGNDRLMASLGVALPDGVPEGTTVHVAVGGVYAGSIGISDTLKETSAKTVSRLRSMGIKRILMLTGDNVAAAEKTAVEAGIDEVYAKLLPGDKLNRFETVLKQDKAVFVGDGMNDAPVLARATVGVSVGDAGSAAAAAAADVVIVNGNPESLCEAIKVSRKTRAVMLQNIVFALSVKAVVLVLGAAGMANLWIAVFADVGVALIAVANALRVIPRFKNRTDREVPK